MQLKQASILIVDDEPVLLDIMAEWFSKPAGRVFRAPDGMQALEILAAEKIDLIVTDVRMPVMDGVTLLKTILARGSHTRSVIFITGFADIDFRDAYDLGAEALLEKPIERDDLISVVRRSLLEPDERWRTPPAFVDCPLLRRSFPSLAAALQGREIAFGRGGFCLAGGDVAEEGQVNVSLDFKADGYVLSGQGVVRWLANSENQLGVELTYVAESSRARAIELTADAATFIPRTTGRKQQALAG